LTKPGQWSAGEGPGTRHGDALPEPRRGMLQSCGCRMFSFLSDLLRWQRLFIEHDLGESSGSTVDVAPSWLSIV
jgi:hypothetical protein